MNTNTKDDLIVIGFMILVAAIMLSIMIFFNLNNKFHAQKVTTRYMKYCAEPVGYLKRIKATNKTALMYLSKGNIKGAEYAIKSENKQINKIIK
jgi:hypothetical protein